VPRDDKVSVRIGSVLALILAAAVAATTAQAAPRLSASAYREQASAICAGLNRMTLPDTGSLADRFTTGLEKGREALAALGRLRPPQALAKLHAQALANAGRRADLLASLIAELRAGTISLAQFGNRWTGSPLVARARSLWEQLGVTACVRY